MGFSTRIDVPLRAVPPVASQPAPQRAEPSPQRAESRRAKEHPSTPVRASLAPESFTDLDVLGVSIAPGFRVQSAIVDCKTGGASAISRMFWLRGLADFFAADSAYMVRERAISPGAKQLARRLGIAALTGSDVKALEDLHASPMPLASEPLSLLFDADHVATVFSRLASQDRRLKPLLDFRQFDYWVIDEHLNLMQVVEQLHQVKDHLIGNNAQHLGIVLDCAWLYVLSLAHALQSIRDVHIADVRYGLREYMLGGARRLREREGLEEIFERLQERGQIPQEVDVRALPAYFAGVLELATRLLRRSEHIVEAMRYLEVTSSLAIAGVRRGAVDAFQGEFNPVVGKLAMNVVTFLCSAADLNPQFAVLANELLVENTAASRSPAGTKNDRGGDPSRAVPTGVAPVIEDSKGVKERRLIASDDGASEPNPDGVLELDLPMDEDLKR